MMKATIHNRCAEATGYRAARVRSLFNCESGAEFHRVFELPLDTAPGWRIGLVVGPSGSGKTSLGRLLGTIHDPDWPEGIPIIDAITPGGSFDAVTSALSAVGLGDVPAWLRPYTALSNGERFRANLARLVATGAAGQTVVVDEFTSVVDRQIARIGAGAFGKAWRRRKDGGQVVLLSCHHDVAKWLQPDWIFDTASGGFSLTAGCLRRPEIQLDVRPASRRVWRDFDAHHYLKLPDMVAQQNYVGFADGEPVAHLALSPKFESGRHMRACRLVVMPEWQGAGVGLAFLEAVCDLQLRGENRWGRQCFTLFHTSHPQLVAALRLRRGWLHMSAGLFGGNKARSAASLSRGGQSGSGFGGHLRAVHGFKYIGKQDL
jgi:ABC-type transport system involved in cytochrome c biogenesis ATPase subunit/GNAT superfamily N-acetyltransferase